MKTAPLSLQVQNHRINCYKNAPNWEKLKNKKTLNWKK